MTDGSNAAAGDIGEYLSAESSANTPVTNAVITNIITLALTAGDWEVSGYIRLLPDAGITITGFTSGPTATSAANPAPINRTYSPYACPSGTGVLSQIGRHRFNASANTTIYLTVAATFTGTGNCNAQGALTAIRTR